MFEGKETRSLNMDTSSRRSFRLTTIAGLILSTLGGLSILPITEGMPFFSTRLVKAQNPSESGAGKLATDGPPPENLQANQPNATATSVGRQVVINFDELQAYTVVANQYADASFSTDSSNYVIATPQNYGTSVPNISRAYRFGAWTNGFPPYNHFAPLTVNFPSPVNDLAFHVPGVDNFGVIAQLDIYQNGRYTTTQPIYGNGNKFIPLWLNVGASYGSITRIEVKSITDTAGITFDNFSFTVPATTPTPTPTPLPSPSPTPPAAPTNLKATPDESEITLSWTASHGATSYSVKRTGTNSSSSAGGENIVSSSSFTPIGTVLCNNPSVPCNFHLDAGLSSDTTYTYVVSAGNSAGVSADSASASAKPLPKPGCQESAITKPSSGSVSNYGWTMNYDFTERDGLVISEVYLNGKRMAKQMSVPYFWITTFSATNPNLIRTRGELTPAGTGTSIRSRLVNYKINPADPNKIFIEAKYAIDQIPGAPKACLNVSQKYEFYSAGSSPPDLVGPCEPSNTVIPCNKFRPMTEYSFHGRDGEFLSSFNSPIRLHFQNTTTSGNTVALTRDFNDPREAISARIPFANVLNPLETAWWSKVIVQRSPHSPNKDANSVDNFHQTNDRKSVFLPGLKGWVPTFPIPKPVVSLAGCPECVHFHWRWGRLLPGPNFRNGLPLVPPGSDQAVDIQIVPFKNVFENFHPTDYYQLFKPKEPLRNPAKGVKEPYDVVLWYSPTGFANSDTFFWHTAWFTPEVLNSSNSVALEQSNDSQTVSNVQDGAVSVEFGSVYVSGNATISSYDPSTVAPLPAGYAALNNAGYLVDTTGIVSGPHIVNFRAASVTDQTAFNNLRIFYAEPDPFDPEKPVWTDVTISSPDIQAPNFSAKTLSGRSDRLGVFVIAQLVQSPPSPGLANLRVSSADSQDPITAGNNLTYNITVANDGPQAATDVALRNSLSPDVTLVSVTPSQGTCKDIDSVVYCSLNSLPAGASATVTLEVQPTEGTDSFPAEGKMIANTAFVRSKESDGDPNNDWVSEETKVMPNPNKPPTVGITNPVSGAFYVGPTTIELSALATDSDGSISRVDFFDNGELMGSGVPIGGNAYSISKTIGSCEPHMHLTDGGDHHGAEAPCGSHSFVAVATDNAGRQNVSSPVDVIVNGAVTVSVTNPTAGTLINPGSDIPLSASANHPSGIINKLQFYANGQPLGEGAPIGAGQYTFTWNDVPAGSYSIFAIVTDGAGITSTSVPVNIVVATRPTVVLNTPAEGNLFPSSTNISVSATAQSAFSTIARVDFYANGVLIGTSSEISTTQFTATWRHVPDGVYSLIAIATDNLGISNASAPVSIGVNTSSPRPGEYIWFDDSLPLGSTPSGDGESWHWVDANPGSVSGQLAHQSRNFAQLDAPNTSAHQHYFLGATAKLPVNVGDTLFTYIFLDINNLPREIMLQWHDGNNWEHRAYWGQNQIGFGIDGTNSRRYMGPIPTAGKWVRLEIPASAVGLEGVTVSGMSFTLDAGRATWDASGKVTPNSAPPPVSAPGDFVWLEDSLPDGAIPAAEHDHWEWVSTAPSPYSGLVCHRSFLANSTGTPRLRSHSFTGAQTQMQINPGDVLFTYVYLDPTHTPDEIMVQWHDGTSWEHRVFWGRNFADIGVTGTESRRYAGGLPPAGVWTRLEIPASYVGLEGKTVSGMAFGYYKENDRARVSWDHSGKNPSFSSVPLPLSALTPLWRIRGTGGGGYYRFTTKDVAGWDETFTFVGYVDPKQAAGTVPFHAFREGNDFNSKFFYSTNLNGAPSGWIYVGIAFYVYPDASTPGTVPLHLFSDNTGYFYTTNANEGAGKTPLGIVGYISATNPIVPAPPSHLHYDGTWMRWKDNSGTETGFKVERRENFDQPWNPIKIEVLPANTTAWQIFSPWNMPQFRVRATNSFGDSAYSNIACGCDEYWVESPNTAPEIYIASPVHGGAVGRDFTVSVNVFDDNGAATVTRVELYGDGIRLSESTEAPYLFVWNNAPSGLHTLTAVATDAAGTTKTSAPVTVTVSGPPIVSITSPSSGSLFTAPATISVEAGASDADGSVSKVEFFQGEVKIGEDVTAPYAFTWTNVPAGSYQLGAKAIDNNGLSSSSAFVPITVNSLPTVTITGPADGLVVDSPANLTINASALDNDGTVNKVDFYRGTTLIGTDTTYPYAVAWNNVGYGVYSLTAKATDNRGAITTSAAITITVNNPPTVAITIPASGSVVNAPANLTISVSASDNDGTISKVNFYQGTTLIATDTSSPYTIDWNGVGYGIYSLTAKATDNSGAVSTSTAITITVNNPPGLGQIIFVSNRDGSSQLYSMNTDGTDPIRRTEHSANDECPRWSPNNTRVVFQSDRLNPFSGLADIYVMNPDGSGQTRLTTDPADDSAPVWSPDGTKIAFQSARNGTNYQVYVMNADGSGQMNISNTTSNDGQPSWSPDGTKIAFTSDRDHAGKASIYVMNASGSNQTRLTLSGVNVTDDQPMWSPDGSRIAFVSTRDSILETWGETDDNGDILIRTRLHINKEVYVMNADGSNQIRLTNSLENDDSPVWSRDGTKLLFRSDRERECCDPMAQMWVMNADGSNQLNLSNSNYGDFGGSW